MLFSLLKHHFDLNITDTALKVSRSVYCFTTSISHGVENYFPRLWVRASLMLFFIELSKVLEVANFRFLSLIFQTLNIM